MPGSKSGNKYSPSGPVTTVATGDAGAAGGGARSRRASARAAAWVQQQQNDRIDGNNGGKGSRAKVAVIVTRGAHHLRSFSRGRNAQHTHQESLPSAAVAVKDFLIRVAYRRSSPPSLSQIW